jgi:hypothetical protein
MNLQLTEIYVFFSWHTNNASLVLFPVFPWVMFSLCVQIPHCDCQRPLKHDG